MAQGVHGLAREIQKNRHEAAILTVTGKTGEAQESLDKVQELSKKRKSVIRDEKSASKSAQSIRYTTGDNLLQNDELSRLKIASSIVTLENKLNRMTKKMQNNYGYCMKNLHKYQETLREKEELKMMLDF